nr:SDR family NAD(P)-dependent oxidoreductase [Stakelama flava]
MHPNRQGDSAVKTFDRDATTEEVLAGHDLCGKRVFITGISAGLGLETARALASHGAEVIGTARDVAKGDAALKSVREEIARSGGSIRLVPMDLADLASVRSVADALVTADEPLDLVIANAGIMATPALEHTKEGFELQFGTNFLGHFVLAQRLAPLMREGGRLIVLSSNAHRMADVDLVDYNFESTPYDPWTAYGRSKTADALLAIAFDARHRDRGVRAASVHPGGIQTELTRSLEPDAFMAAFQAMHEEHLKQGNPPFEGKTIPQGAATTIWAAIAADADEIGGHYCEDCHVAEVLADNVETSAFNPGVRRYANDLDHAEALWAKAAELTGEKP